jgi:hypothetical protein
VRRWFHCLLIGALACSLSVDTAKACWYLRCAHAARGCGRPACPPVVTWPACHEVVCEEVVVHDSACCQEVAPGPIAVSAEAVSPEQPSEQIVAVEPTPTPVEPTPTPVEPSMPSEPPAETGAAVAPVVPHLQPALDTERDVEPAVALEPAPAEPTPEPAPVMAAVEPPEPPANPNLFEEVEAEADAELLAPAPTEPAAQPDEPTPTNAIEEPAAEEPAAAEPAGPSTADPFGAAGSEPLRRWIDDTGSYATVGMLVELRADGVEIRKGNGRSVIVPLDRLSDHDRSYAAAAGARLAAERTASSSATAGL